MKRRRKRLFVILSLLLVLSAGVLVFININLRPVLVGLSASRVQAAAARAMNDAILEVLRAEEGDGYGSLVNVYETNGKVYLLQANSTRLNTLSADCANEAQSRIASLGEQGISVPLGTLSGIPLLSGIGPRITLYFTPAGAVNASFESEFRSAGINQTLHRVILRLTASVRVILPGESHTLTVEAEAPVAENIIVGDVPDAYTNVANEEDLLNLIPGD